MLAEISKKLTQVSIDLVAIVVGRAVMFGFFKKIRKTAFLSNFLASYNYMKRTQGSSDEEALRRAITVFVYRWPFNVLDSDDIQWLAKTFATLPDPKALGLILVEMDVAGDATGLKKRETILDLCTLLRRQSMMGGRSIRMIFMTCCS